MKIAVCQVSQETNTFSDRNFDLDDFMPEGWILPENLTASFRGTGTYLGGAIRAAEEWNADLVPLHTARSEAGYPLKTEALTEIMDVICSDLEAVRDEIDGLFLAQHGGGTTRDHTSLEEYVMERVRAVIGDKPMMSSLDMHCNITPAMLRLSDGLFPIKEFPHVDTAQAGYKAMTALICTVRGEIRPWMGWMSIPQIYPNTAICTLMNPMKEVKAHFAAYAEDHGLMDASVCQGFSGGDTYMSGASVLVMADGRNVRKEAEELGAYLWGKRDEFEPLRLSPGEAIEKALAGRKNGFVIVNESTDNPGSGCPGDGTHLLRELIERNLPGSLFLNIYDPAAAEKAYLAGPGAVVSLTVGGRTEAICGAPLSLENVRVLAVSGGEVLVKSPMNQGTRFLWGKTVRVKYRNTEILITSRRAQTIDDSLLEATGGKTGSYSLVCLKSAAHFRAYFQDMADAIVTAETPGLRSTDLSSYPYRHIRRPVFPLDREAFGNYPSWKVSKGFKNTEYIVEEVKL